MSSTEKAVIVVFGVNGQDGSYAAQYFESLGHQVVGIGRQFAPRWIVETKTLRYHQCDLTDSDAVLSLLRALNPSVVFNAAAVHGPSGFFYETNWKNCFAVNAGLTNVVLEYCRAENDKCRYLFLSSSKVFDLDSIEYVRSDSPRKSSCIYTITKNAADDLIRYYRRIYGIKSSIVYTFNHESPRRSVDYFIPKLCSILVDCIREGKTRSSLHTLDFWCDWGDAREFMQCSAELILAGTCKDICLATGSLTYARDLARELFDKCDLRYLDFIRERVTAPARATQRPRYSVCMELPSELAVYRPRSSVIEICDAILTTNYGVRLSDRSQLINPG